LRIDVFIPGLDQIRRQEFVNGSAKFPSKDSVGVHIGLQAAPCLGQRTLAVSLLDERTGLTR
jgi:hypothetical protein